MSVRLSVRMFPFGPHWTDFLEDILNFEFCRGTSIFCGTMNTILETLVYKELQR